LKCGRFSVDFFARAQVARKEAHAPRDHASFK
jgi:hypothetical protein